MNPAKTQPGFFSSLDAFDEPVWDETGAPKEAHVTSYQAAMLEPTTSLVGGTFDRPDVAAVAILGYN
ncbi:hypothetical protein DIE14_32520 [Burkholderia sp. Bp9017]|uniref:Uncharacterized protein n=1 Tax=Burkholderia anthina TaxID=179879 RepID=A0A7T7AKS2_9BURK|nr:MULTISPECIES: hypothetical protein [Burkholderia]MBY4869710.1 hypothetical protein [Burkholderia anthina]QQK06077.1 hypothetical protein JFN94_19650 [Burkholderia anthina]RQZ16422.1 hypothetical protein DIE14_32520 [Burkholderia sp. Bp9017]RQZ27417.1 hypothetical protein DIE13_29280 [Burkholderia sp. Bp9016]